MFKGSTFLVKGYPGWDGDYPYTLSNGILSFTSDQCPNSTCNAIYHNDLGILWVSRLGNSLLIR